MASDITALRELLGNYRGGITQIDINNTNIDSQIATLRLQIKGLEAEKVTNLEDREQRIRKLNGIRRLLRELEDVETQRIRDREDREFDQ